MAKVGCKPGSRVGEHKAIYRIKLLFRISNFNSRDGSTISPLSAGGFRRKHGPLGNPATIYTSGERKKENLSDFLAYLSKRHKTSDGRRYTQNGRNNLTSGILQETRRTSTAFLKRITIRNHYFHARRVFPASAIFALQPISTRKPASVLRGKPRDTLCWSRHNVSYGLQNHVIRGQVALTTCHRQFNAPQHPFV